MIYTEPSREKLLKPKILSFRLTHTSPCKENEVTEFSKPIPKKNENLYRLVKETDMVKYVSVKGLK